MSSNLKTLIEMGIDPVKVKALGAWKLTAVLNEECVTYIAHNEATFEALLVDPKFEDVSLYKKTASEMVKYDWIAVIDTHTHADHVSAAAEMSIVLGAPLVMHVLSPSSKIDLKVCKKTHLFSKAGKLVLVPTPGHTADSMTAIWGPFAFTGDTVFIDDVGRDDLPSGSPESHYESLQSLKTALTPEMIILPGHDFKGGRASIWSDQLQTNESLTQEREQFVKEAHAYQAAPPKDFKRSLFENFK